MADFVFYTEPLDYQSNKLNALQQEVYQLQDEINDLEQMLNINRNALKISLAPFIQNSPNEHKNKFCQNDDTIMITNDTLSTKNHSKNLINQIDIIYDENTKLYNQIHRLTKERNIAQSKALISEQICEEAQRHELEAVHEMEDKINELRKLLQDKEYTIQELEKIKPIMQDEGILLKYREIINPNEQALKMQQELDNLTSMISKVSKAMNKIQVEKQDWQNVNFNLLNEISKLRATFSSPLNAPLRGISGPKFKMEDENANNSCIGFMNDGNSTDSEIAPPLENKVILNTKENNSGGKIPVPKLDLTKAKKIQEINVKKSTQQVQNQSTDIKALEKLKSLEIELEAQKKLLSREMVTNKNLADDLALAIDSHKSLISQNETLIKSNKKYEEKWQKIFYTLEFYKEFYHKYLDLITNKFQNKKNVPAPFNRKLEKLEKLKEKYNIDIIDTNPDDIIKGLKKIDEENGRLMNNSILEVGETNRNSICPPLSQNGYNPAKPFKLSREQCKNYLLNLAKELQAISNTNKSNITKKMLKLMEKKRYAAHKRSQSNPLDYINNPNRKYVELSSSTKKPKNQNRVNGHLDDMEKPRDIYTHRDEIKHEEEKFDKEIDQGNSSPNLINKQNFKKIPTRDLSPILSYPKSTSKTKKLDEDLSFIVSGKNNEVSFLSNGGDIFNQKYEFLMIIYAQNSFKYLIP